MALLDFLKKKDEAEKAKTKPAKKPAKASVVKEEKIKAEPAAPKAVKTAKAGNTKFSFDAVKQPHISEKASDLSIKDQYIFKVNAGYNKKEIKDAVEGIYNVDVLAVNIIKIPAKKRRLGRTEGFRKAYKKAIVKIKNGQKIEIL